MYLDSYLNSAMVENRDELQADMVLIKLVSKVSMWV